ncbi:MAG: transglutaminase-like domain-containing protein, partial [Nitrospiraceae bacterium]|nr:transglutaminase-like domain-containing protein [Nitrospiraceae bacterium]
MRKRESTTRGCGRLFRVALAGVFILAANGYAADARIEGVLQERPGQILLGQKIPVLGTVPYRNLDYPSKEPFEGQSIKPAYKGGPAKTVTPEDTGETEEAPFSMEIASVAQSLDWSPVRIYAFVMNNIDTEWYWGCMKGAEETLRQRSGNDCDQATLLVALMRVSGFPARYVRGTAEIFAGGKKANLDKARNLFSTDDPLAIAEQLQKAGIPYRPVIAGGKISNFQLEHIWAEALIPYGNYRGAIIDDSGKTWLGLDTSIKIRWYDYNKPADITQAVPLAGIRDEYLGVLRNETPLEYIRDRLSAVNGSQPYEDYQLRKTLRPFLPKILPLGLQFEQRNISGEYTEIPDELKHKVRFVAADPRGSALFDITLETRRVTNRKVIVAYEPETVEDQGIIDSYGGLDYTPAYLVRLRPVLKVDGRMVAAGRDGLMMGSDHALEIELISPNGIEKITATHITGNVSAIGITAGNVNPSGIPSGGVGDDILDKDDAETILSKEAYRYMDRWNKAEDELGSLLRLNLARPIPAVVTVGGVIEVTYLL